MYLVPQYVQDLEVAGTASSSTTVEYKEGPITKPYPLIQTQNFRNLQVPSIQTAGRRFRNFDRDRDSSFCITYIRTYVQIQESYRGLAWTWKGIKREQMSHSRTALYISVHHIAQEVFVGKLGFNRGPPMIYICSHDSLMGNKTAHKTSFRHFQNVSDPHCHSGLSCCFRLWSLPHYTCWWTLYLR